MSTIDSMMSDKTLDAFSDSYFVNVVLRSHIPLMKAQGLYTLISIDPIDFYKYLGDFYGILDLKNIPKKYHSFILKFNGGVDTCTFDFNGNNYFYLPSIDYLDQLSITYVTDKFSFM